MRFRLKLTLAMLCLVSLMFGIGGSLLISEHFDHAVLHEQNTAYSTYQSVLGMLQLVCGARQPSDQGDIAELLDELLSELPSLNAGCRGIRLYSGDKTIYREGELPPAGELEHIPEICSVSHVSWGDARFLALSGTLDVAGETLFLDMFYDITSEFVVRTQELRAYDRMFVLFVVLCAILSYALSYALTRPLTKLSEASRDIASGELSCRADIRTSDEIGRVAEDFNVMADTLEKNIAELEESVERQKRFTGSFAHEVKTPMTSIIGYADLIRGGTLDDEERSQAANFIVTEGKRLERLSQKLLQLQLLQSEEITLSAAEPAALLSALADEWGPVYRQQGVTLVCAGEEGSCLLEPELVKTLLINLWDNARKAGAKWISVRSEMLPDGCRITVRDDGQGIPAEALSHLTEAFYRVDKSRARSLGGAGLGLSLCQEIVSLHNGDIRFASEPEHGTTVTVELKGGRP